MADDDLNDLLFKRRIVQLRGPIDADSYANLITKLIHLDAKSRKLITILIDSKGGDVDQALSMHDVIRSLRCPTKGLVIGECSSSALAVLVACTRKLALPHAQFMFHYPRRTHTFQLNRRFGSSVKDWCQYSVQSPRALRTVLLERSALRARDLAKLERIGSELNLTVGACEVLRFGMIDGISNRLDVSLENRKGG